MPSKHDPADTLADIVENAERIETYLAGIDRQALGEISCARAVHAEIYHAGACRSTPSTVQVSFLMAASYAVHVDCGHAR